MQLLPQIQLAFAALSTFCHYTPILPNSTSYSEMSSSKLFQPIQVGDLQLQNRVVLAPLTRVRAVDGHVPIQPLVSEYYAQRASSPGTLLISEATFIDARAGGITNAPGIWSEEQIASWKQVSIRFPC